MKINISIEVEDDQIKKLVRDMIAEIEFSFLKKISEK